MIYANVFMYIQYVRVYDKLYRCMFNLTLHVVDTFCRFSFEKSLIFFDIFFSFVGKNEGQATFLCVFLSAVHRSRDVTASSWSFAGRSFGTPGEKTNEQTNKWVFFNIRNKIKYNNISNNQMQYNWTMQAHLTVGLVWT